MMALRLSSITKKFGGLKVLQGVDLEVVTGEKHAIIGPNGAGKSTLFNIISGRTRPTSGSVKLEGSEISGLSPRSISRRGLARSFQIINVFPHLTVFENLRSSVISRRKLRWRFWKPLDSYSEIARETEQLLEQMELSARRDCPAGILSYGQQRELEIALTVGTDPKLLLLDEPCAGLNAEDTEKTVSLIKRISSDRTLLIVEHDMNVVFRLADRISVLHYGRVLATGSADVIRSNEEVRLSYLGKRSHAAN